MGPAVRRAPESARGRSARCGPGRPRRTIGTGGPRTLTEEMGSSVFRPAMGPPPSPRHRHPPAPRGPTNDTPSSPAAPRLARRGIVGPPSSPGLDHCGRPGRRGLPAQQRAYLEHRRRDADDDRQRDHQLRRGRRVGHIWASSRSTERPRPAPPSSSTSRRTTARTPTRRATSRTTRSWSRSRACRARRLLVPVTSGFTATKGGILAVFAKDEDGSSSPASAIAQLRRVRRDADPGADRDADPRRPRRPRRRPRRPRRARGDLDPDARPDAHAGPDRDAARPRPRRAGTPDPRGGASRADAGGDARRAHVDAPRRDLPRRRRRSRRPPPTPPTRHGASGTGWGRAHRPRGISLAGVLLTPAARRRGAGHRRATGCGGDPMRRVILSVTTAVVLMTAVVPGAFAAGRRDRGPDARSRSPPHPGATGPYDCTRRRPNLRSGGVLPTQPPADGDAGDPGPGHTRRPDTVAAPNPWTAPACRCRCSSSLGRPRARRPAARTPPGAAAPPLNPLRPHGDLAGVRGPVRDPAGPCPGAAAQSSKRSPGQTISTGPS